MTTRNRKQPTAAEAIGCKEPPYQGSNLMHTTISSTPNQDKPHAIILVLVIAGSVAAAAIGVAVSAAPMVTVTAACIQTLAIVLATAAAIGA